jgi:hypothetical protein
MRFTINPSSIDFVNGKRTDYHVDVKMKAGLDPVTATRINANLAVFKIKEL